MLDKEGATPKYLKYGQEHASHAAPMTETEKLVTPLTQTVEVGLQIMQDNPRAGGDYLSLLNDPRLIALQPAEKLRENRIGIIQQAAEDMVSQLESLMQNSEDEGLVQQARQLALDFKGTNPVHGIETRFKIMQLMLPLVSLHEAAFEQLKDPSMGSEKYKGLFILRPFNLPDNLVENLEKIVTAYPPLTLN